MDGIWVGRVSKSDEHLVLTERGAIYSLTVRPHPQGEHVREIFDKVRGLPWNPSGRVEPIVRSDEPPPVQTSTSRQEYLREFGKTANCRACEGIRGRHHTKFCQDRFEAWRKGRGFSGVPTDQRDTEPVMTGDLLDPEVAGSTLPPDCGRKRDETESDQPPAARRRLVSKQGEKRDADQELGPESSQRPRVEAVSIADLQSSYPTPTETSDNYRGEGEFDGVCVEEDLDVDEIKKLAEWHGFDGVATEMAMRAEAKSLSDFGVYEEVQSSDVPSGTRIIGSKIVLRERHGKVKARLCAQDFAHHQKRDDLYSPTPSVTALRLLLSLASNRGHRLRIGEFSTAFLHAPMDIETFVRPPQVYAKQGVLWRLRKALYGMRRAPKLFFNLLHEILSELGMQSLRSEPTFYFKGSLLLLVHVDDPLVAGTDEDIEWIFSDSA